MSTKTRPLSSAQSRALMALAVNYDLWIERGKPGDHAGGFGSGFTKPPNVSETTLYALKNRGLVETRELPTTTIGRITEKGLALLRGGER